MPSVADNTCEKANVETNTMTGDTTNTPSNAATDTAIDTGTTTPATTASSTTAHTPTDTATGALPNTSTPNAAITATPPNTAQFHDPSTYADRVSPKLRYLRNLSLQNLELLRQLNGRSSFAAADHDTIMHQIMDLDAKVSSIAEEQVDVRKVLGRVLRVLRKMNVEAVAQVDREEREEKEEKDKEEAEKGKGVGKKA